MEPIPSSLSNCCYTRTNSSSSIRFILFFWVLFFVFSYIPLAVEGKARYSEYCSTSPSHLVECSDPNAECFEATMTRYGSCRCPENFHTIHLSDATSTYFKTQCLKPRASPVGQCKNSFECQWEDAGALCTFESANGSRVCACRDIDGYSSSGTPTRCVHSIERAEGNFADYFLLAASAVAFAAFFAVICWICRTSYDTPERRRDAGRSFRSCLPKHIRLSPVAEDPNSQLSSAPSSIPEHDHINRCPQASLQRPSSC